MIGAGALARGLALRRRGVSIGEPVEQDTTAVMASSGVGCFLAGLARQ
jgi:hypothetical protein